MLRGLVVRGLVSAATQESASDKPVSETDKNAVTAPQSPKPAAAVPAAQPAAASLPSAPVAIIHPSYGPKYEPPTADCGANAPRILVLLKIASTLVLSVAKTFDSGRGH